MSLFSNNNFIRELGRYNWGLTAELSEGAVKELGIRGALREAQEGSPHRASSGMSARMSRKERKEHYTRKAILEREKEAERRARWERRHPGALEANWERREARRKTLKAATRAARTERARRSSSGKRRR